MPGLCRDAAEYPFSLACCVIPSRGPSFRPVNLTQLRERNAALDASSRGWRRYLEACIDPVDVEVGAAFVAQGDKRRGKV